MLGAIIGDIVGSRFEFHNHRSKDFELFTNRCFFTDDSVMSIALAKAVMDSLDGKGVLRKLAVKYMQMFGRRYPDRGYGGRFRGWLWNDEPKPYCSFGNGSAMRVSACGFAGNNIEEVKKLSYDVTCVTHNHPEGIKGAEATAVCVFLARQGKTIPEIREYVNNNYYKLDFSIDEIRPTYRFNEICQDTVPQAIEAFLESTSFEDAIRIAISLGGDSDTIGAITGSIAEAYYGIPDDIRKHALTYLDDNLRGIVETFENRFQKQ